MYSKSKVFCAIALALSTPAAFAESSSTSTAQDNDVETIVVTARAGSKTLRKSEASYAVSTISEQDLMMDAPMSVADVMKSVPGFWVESSGGEASNNIRVRGIPRDGYSSISLQENGLAIQHDGGLGYLNSDQSFRLDETIERVEVVRGGPSSVFASNAPGGVVNFITRKAYDGERIVFKTELGDYSHGRIDGYYGTPIGEDMFVSVGGFYRTNDGVRDPGFDANKGGQIRFTLGKRFDSGELLFDYRYLNDRTAFLLPVPLAQDSNGDITSMPGFDANYGSFMSPEVEHNRYRDPSGNGYDFDLGDGTHTTLHQYSMSADFNVSEWTIKNSFRYRLSDTLRNGLFPTGGLESANDRIASYENALAGMIPGDANVELRFANHPGLTFDPNNNAGNGMVLNGNLLSVDVPLDEIINDLRISRQFNFGEQSHDVSFGVYYADYDYEFNRYMATAMFEVRDQPRLLDAVVTHNGEDILAISENGILRYGSLYNRVDGEGQTLAAYVADEWQINDQLRIDLGARYEWIELGGQVEGTTVIDLEQSASLADDQFITGNGIFTPIDESYNELAWTIGANYQINKKFGFFGRYTDSFRTPNASDFNGNPERDDLRVEPISMAEVGLKYVQDNLNVYATAFYTYFDNMRFTDYAFDNDTNTYTQQTAYGDTETFGIELEALWTLTDWFDLGATATLQSPEYKTFSFTNSAGEAIDFGGNQLIRVPEDSARITAGFNLLDGDLRTELVVEHYGDRYGDVANQVVLPEYQSLNASVMYYLTPNLTFQLNAQNLTNEIGLTEGNPRAGQFIGEGQQADGYFLARPILGRTIRASLRYQF
ncbi:TonB-dependent receptor [Pseudidiomarina sediminum]|uniref:TonB-dependent receptor n=1 Tax=Pseudidiomarina sediminum TaxID=431675 RepID=A0A432Z303_9GAMM|nr:TonB-dependent receptor [Pseudidiomarina sediminum]RUO72265.1 TonB-dependent receptor [Pseudidiomarina sediminum]